MNDYCEDRVDLGLVEKVPSVDQAQATSRPSGLPLGWEPVGPR